MAFIELLDRLLQFFGLEFLERAIERVSRWLTQLLVSFSVFWNKSDSKSNNFHLVLLQRSENFIVVDKPQDLLINSNDPNKVSVQTLLKKQFPELINDSLFHDFFFAHRLDYSTSGILCIPLNKKACIAMSKSLEDRKCQKFYIALVNGHLDGVLRMINCSIGDDTRYEHSSKKMCTTSPEDYCRSPRKSLTYLAVIAKGYFGKRPVTKVLLKPVTGRRHQLRVHCESIGHPIVGDYTYGTLEDKNATRMYLHAIKLIVPNDVEQINVETTDPFNEENLKDWKCESDKPVNFKHFYKILEEGVT